MLVSQALTSASPFIDEFRRLLANAPRSDEKEVPRLLAADFLHVFADVDTETIGFCRGERFRGREFQCARTLEQGLND